MELGELLALVLQVRKAQRLYFRDRDRAVLVEAKGLEQQLDAALRAIDWDRIPDVSLDCHHSLSQWDRIPSDPFGEKT